MSQLTLWGSTGPTFSTNTTSESHILLHDSNTFGVDGTQVGVFEQTNKIGFRSLLEGGNRSTLETQISFVILSKFTNQTLEGQLTNQQFGRFLETTNFTEGDSSRLES